MNLKVAEWQKFRFGDLISDIYISNAINRDDLIQVSNETEAIRYITRTSQDNGCEFLAEKEGIEESLIEAENAITVGDTTATCFYQDKEFITGAHIVVIRADWLNQYTASFVLTLLNREAYKYSYGRAFLIEKIKDTNIRLPATRNVRPDWDAIEQYIKSLRSRPITTSNVKPNRPPFDLSTWMPFVTYKLFPRMEAGKASQQTVEVGRDCFYVGAKRDDNGVMFHCARDESLISKGNCIIFICNGQGSVGYANYMDVDFLGTADIIAGYNEHLNVYVGLFLATIYSKERPKYSYGRKWRTHHLRDTVVYLPIQRSLDGAPIIDATKEYSDNGFIPDWEFMETYIKALPYGDRLVNGISLT